jgi:hypothetical protein
MSALVTSPPDWDALPGFGVRAVLVRTVIHSLAVMTGLSVLCHLDAVASLLQSVRVLGGWIR